MQKKTVKELEQQIEQLNATIDYQEKIIENCKQVMRDIDKGVYDVHYSENPDLTVLAHRIAELELILFGEKAAEGTAKPQETAGTKPAGRKKHNAAWQQAFNEWRDLYLKGSSPEEICRALNISLMTHYRYKKEYEKTT